MLFAGALLHDMKDRTNTARADLVTALETSRESFSNLGANTARAQPTL